jgi:hypothetical protein
MPTSKTVYPDSHALTSDTFRAERNEHRDMFTEWLGAIREEVEVLYYAALVCGPGGLIRINTRWMGFCPIRPHVRSHGVRKTFEVDHEANRWSCSACAMSGDAIDLAKAVSRCDHDVAAAHVLMSAFRIFRFAEGA